MAELKCSRCEVTLDKIRYVEPDWSGNYRKSLSQRPPLCESCWKKRTKEEITKHQKGG